MKEKHADLLRPSEAFKFYLSTQMGMLSAPPQNLSIDRVNANSRDIFFPVFISTLLAPTLFNYQY